MDVEVLKKVSLTSKSLHEEKLKLVKAATKGGKKTKGGRVVLKMDKATDNYGDDDYGGGDNDDFEKKKINANFFIFFIIR